MFAYISLATVLLLSPPVRHTSGFAMADEAHKVIVEVLFNELISDRLFESWRDYLLSIGKKYPTERRTLTLNSVDMLWESEGVNARVFFNTWTPQDFNTPLKKGWADGLSLVIADLTDGVEVLRYDLGNEKESQDIPTSRGKKVTYGRGIKTLAMIAAPVDVNKATGGLKVEHLYKIWIEEDTSKERVDKLPIFNHPKYLLVFRPRNRHEESLVLARLGMQLLLRDRDFDGAEELFRQSQEKEPGFYYPKYCRVRLLEEKREFGAAWRLLSEIREDVIPSRLVRAGGNINKWIMELEKAARGREQTTGGP